MLGGRRGVEIRTNTRVQSIEPGKVHLPNDAIEAETIILAAGIIPSPVVAALPVDKGQRGHISVHATMQCPTRPELWAVGDCASIPAADGRPYPNLAQHALREAKVLSRNLLAAKDGRPLQPFVYDNLGMMGSLGHCQAFGQLIKVRGARSLAWFVRRSYYLMQMPGPVRKLRIMIDWAFGLLFSPDIVKISLDREPEWLAQRAQPVPMQRPQTLPRRAGNGQVGSVPDRSDVTRAGRSTQPLGRLP